MIRWATPGDETAIRALFAKCHPGNPQRPEHWYQAVPTLVAEAGEYPVLEMVGFTSFTLSPVPEGFACYGQDVCVDPSVRGAGFGAQLHARRCEIAKALGAKTFIGLTAPDNEAMVRIFQRQGLKPVQTIKNAYPFDTPSTGVVWIGAL